MTADLKGQVQALVDKVKRHEDRIATQRRDIEAMRTAYQRDLQGLRDENTRLRALLRTADSGTTEARTMVVAGNPDLGRQP